MVLARALSKKSTIDLSNSFDILVIGGGNAALCAAIAGRETGATVLVLECAPKHFRGGNSRHTRNLRYLHNQKNKYLTGVYPEDEFWSDLLNVTDGTTNKELARLTIRKSNNLMEWMAAHGCRFQPSMRGTLHLSRTNAFFLGGGKALINAYYATAQRLGIHVLYDAEVYDINIRNNRFESAVCRLNGLSKEIRARSVVVASGGFQANLDWLKEYWGEPADNFIIRGTPYNKGRLLRLLLDKGAAPIGDPRQCHCVAIDARAPKFDGGIVTRLDCVAFGIVVNNQAKRFYDEGEDFWPKRYAIWGRLVAKQPGQIAYTIIDSKSIDMFMPSVFPPIEAGSIREMAAKLELNPDTLEHTVVEFNRSTHPGSFNPAKMDDCFTDGLEPPKSHWARPLDTPPFYGYPLRPGITFTYLGVKVDKQARIIMQNQQPSRNMFAAGEIMSGNILGKGYMAGLGMTIGTVFGRIAGEEAGRYALK